MFRSLLLVAFLSVGAVAQDPLAEFLFPPDLVMQNQTAISLTDAQKTTLRAEVLKAQTRFTELQWELQDAMESLKTQIQLAPSSETVVLGKLDKVLGIEREIKRTQMILLIHIKSLLTMDQQTQLQRLRARSGAKQE